MSDAETKLLPIVKSVTNDLLALSKEISSQGSDIVEPHAYTTTVVRLRHLVHFANDSMPDHSSLFTELFNEFMSSYNDMMRVTNTFYERQHFVTSVQQAVELINNIKEFMSYEQSAQHELSANRLFATAEEKEKEAAKSQETEDYSGVMHNLNTALELALKDKLEIPTTITKIQTSKVINIVVSNKIGPYLFLEEARKHILKFDNETKHEAYKPTKPDCIRAMKAIQDLFAKLRQKPLTVSQDILDKIYSGL